MSTLELTALGPLSHSRLTFGDLTIVVGPQASGKSIALQFLKLMVDAGQVQEEFVRHGIDWSGELPKFLDLYLGEGMRSLWNDTKSRVVWEGRSVDMPGLAKRKRPNKRESLFFIPAQRVLALRDGWPRPFTDYSPGDPFAVREFSEKLRLLVEQELGGPGRLFPHDRRLKREFRELLKAHVFGNFELQIDKDRMQKRFVLSESDVPLPFMVWSAGQREFVPLLLGLYWLMPPTKTPRRGDIEWVVLEEPEMGLHPRAISVVALLALELVGRGYRVCISSHSPHVLEAVWALRHLAENRAAPGKLLELFDARRTPPLQELARTVMKKDIKVYYFDRPSGRTHDISDLDPAADEIAEAEWGGLTQFSARANEAVALSVANMEMER